MDRINALKRSWQRSNLRVLAGLYKHLLSLDSPGIAAEVDEQKHSFALRPLMTG